jgi:alpha-L-rhamnosidase
MLVEYYQHTGDGGLVLRELAPYVHKLLDQFASSRGPNGLLSNAPDYMFMDFKEIGGTVCHHPPAVIGQGYLTAFFCRALQDGQRVAQLAGDPSRVERYRRLHSEVIAAFERELWNPEKGLYRDGKPFQSTTKPHRWLPEDTEIKTFSPASQPTGGAVWDRATRTEAGNLQNANGCITKTQRDSLLPLLRPSCLG